MDERRPRRRGNRRRLGLGLFAVFVGLTTFAVWRISSLRGLPDIGDPFDIEERYRFSIPEDENAWTFYKQAGARLTPEPVNVPVQTDNPSPPPVVRKWIDENRESLKLFVEGSKCTKALYTPLRDLSFDTMLPGVQNLRTLWRLAAYEAANRESNGDVAGAWELYHAGLRASRHSGMNGTIIERLVGIAIHSVAAVRIQIWARNPKVDAKLLRRALDETIAAEALTPPASQMIKSEYLSIRKALATSPEKFLVELPEAKEQPGTAATLMAKGSRLLLREPERSRRVAQLVFANWLAVCDLPATERGRRFAGKAGNTLYKVPKGADPKLHPLTPEQMWPWLETSVYVKLLLPGYSAVNRAELRDESTRAALIVRLAEQLAERETGKEPESVNSLVGKYLKEIPSGYVFDEGPPAELAPKPPNAGP